MYNYSVEVGALFVALASSECALAVAPRSPSRAAATFFAPCSRRSRITGSKAEENKFILRVVAFVGNLFVLSAYGGYAQLESSDCAVAWMLRASPIAARAVHSIKWAASSTKPVVAEPEQRGPPTLLSVNLSLRTATSFKHLDSRVSAYQFLPQPTNRAYRVVAHFSAQYRNHEAYTNTLRRPVPPSKTHDQGCGQGLLQGKSHWIDGSPHKIRRILD